MISSGLRGRGWVVLVSLQGIRWPGIAGSLRTVALAMPGESDGYGVNIDIVHMT